MKKKKSVGETKAASEAEGLEQANFYFKLLDLGFKQCQIHLQPFQLVTFPFELEVPIAAGLQTVNHPPYPKGAYKFSGSSDELDRCLDLELA
jgi:hypothetical protein